MKPCLAASAELVPHSRIRLYYSAQLMPSILTEATRDDAVVVIQSFSKSYCMTSWRLGWLVARRDLAAKAPSASATPPNASFSNPPSTAWPASSAPGRRNVPLRGRPGPAG
ncbi:MAG TPA: aminotransferase class I/II-fold pyridoxal phosphate-dependent enzyme [Bryobacteraceae bacterium]|nr:aminotransferase class I/II-fold pyridoxal phosphate-dependent enzyme [Bryobacteraceae bacterium]